MPRKNNKRTINDTDDELTENEYSETPNNRYWSKSSESETSDNENSESENENEGYDTEGYDTEENIEKVMNNDISDETLKSKEDDINLLSDNFNKMSVEDPNVYINDNTLNKLIIDDYEPINKSVDYCYNQLEQFKIKHYAGSYKNKDGLKCVMDKDFIRINKYDNKEKNDGLFTFNDKTYLMILRVGKMQELRGKLFIEKDDYLTFLKLINNIVNNPNVFNCNYNEYYLNYLERLPPVCPLLIDCDIKYSNKKDYRIYNIIKNDIINECNNILKEYYNLDNPLYYLFEKNNATPKNIIKDGKNKIIFKDGFHLGYMIPINHNEYEGFYNELRQRILLKDSFKKLLNENKDITDTNINEIIDNCMTNNQAYMMIGNTKYEQDNYEPSPYYKLTLTNDENYETNKKYSVILFSNYQFYLTNTEPLKLIKPFNNLLNSSSVDSEDKPKNKKQKLDEPNDNNNDNDLETPTLNKKDCYKSKKEINERYTYEDLERGVNLWNYQNIKEDDKKEIKELKEQKNKIFNKNISDEKGWLFNVCSLLSWFDDKNDLENKKWILINKFSMKLPEFNYDLENNKKIILTSYKKDKYNCVNINHFWANCKEFDEEETLNIINNAYKRNSKNSLIQYEDINEVQSIRYNLLFDKEINFNPYKFDKLFENNIIDAIKYFYKYYIYVGSDTFYKLIFKYEYERKIFEFQEIKGIKNLDLNLKKDLNDKEREFLMNYNEFGYHRIKNAIKKEKKDKYSISFYNVLDTTKTFFTSTIINDITQDLYYGIKGLNKYNIQISNNLYFNENNLKRCLYFDDILNSNIEVEEDNEYLLFFKKYIDNHILKRNEEDNDYNLIEQKRFYIYNYLKTIFNFKKNHTCLILLGGQGSMKSTFGKMIIKCIGEKISRSLTGSEFLNESYNGSILEDNLFIQLEELKVAENGYQHNDMINNLKNLITADTARIRKILKNPSFHKTFISYLITSNYNCPLKISYDDRRYCVFEINNKNKDDKFITELNNLFDNKDALIALYNYFKNTNFTCKCKDKNCIYHNMEKPFEYLDGVLTPEKMKIIQGTSNIFEQFLVDFYYQIKYDYYNEKELNNKKYIIYDNDNFDNSKFNITITKFYGEFKSYLEMKKINKIPKKKIFQQSLIDGLFKESTLDHTEIMNISINEYRKLLFNNHIIDNDDDYNFIDSDGEFINEGSFKPFNNQLIKKDFSF